MKATGIVRRIDDLGRIVIPKEIRRTLRLHEGVPMEIFTDREGEIILKKYSPMAEMGMHAKQYADALAQVSGRGVLITDRDQVIAAAGAGWKETLGKPISRELEQAIANRDNRLSTKGDREFIPVLREDDPSAEQLVATVILSEGDAIGAVVLLEKNAKQKMGVLEQKLALTAASFLGRQMEG
ncbi:MAG: AbrB/MazE/SpoVT family DNA-binding domain-containing protein [Lachnospiraceae bacterium]|nr:AbrB/MazE/SpoVT family DNA-binding domain-containing protein [Lachnospiraceae bacterium]